MVALPFLEVSLKAEKPIHLRSPEKLVTIGDHIKKRRIELGLTQQELASILGINESTLHNWEQSCAKPRGILIPRIVRFLELDGALWNLLTGYPATTTTFREYLLKNRVDSSLTQNQLAHLIGVSVDTIRSWEKGRFTPTRGHEMKIRELFMRHQTL